MTSSRKTSAQQSRNSFAMDDRASQNFVTADQNNRNSVVFVSNKDDDKPEANDTSFDQLKKFETTEFPPEPPLDASCSSLVLTDDDDFSENERRRINQSESADDENEDLTVNEEKPVKKGAFSRNLMMLLLLGLFVLFVAVILEMKFKILESA